LEADILSRSEQVAKVTIPNGAEAPLTLQRSLSQSCDPHTAYITIELGSFEETIGRVDPGELDVPKGSRSSSFSYKVASKIPVDTVGLHRYTMDWNSEKKGRANAAGRPKEERTPGWVIVRVALRGGVKMVTIESPLTVKNSGDRDVLCEVRDHDGLTLVWRSVLHKALDHNSGYMSVPADISSLLDSKMYKFMALALQSDSNFRDESDLPTVDEALFARLSTPPPYSRSSLSKGVIVAKYECLRVLSATPGAPPHASHVHLSSLRIGSFALEQSAKAQGTSRRELVIPEQRMVLFRSPLAVANHLAYHIRVQVRLKPPQRAIPQGNDSDVDQNALEHREWFDLGILACGEAVSWSGASPSERIELRMRFENSAGTVRHEFPSWSSMTVIPADTNPSEVLPRASSSFVPYHKLPDIKLLDSSRSPLFVSVALQRDSIPGDLAASSDNIKSFSEQIPTARRVVSLFTPFWVVDNTGLDLQYKSGSLLAGQTYSSLCPLERSVKGNSGSARTLGLGELLDDTDLVYLPSRISFEVLMIGDDRPKRLHVRRRQTRLHTQSDVSPPWSDAISLAMDDNSYRDTTVLPPPLNGVRSDDRLLEAETFKPFALRTRLLPAPQTFGGVFGTKIIHVVCRYVVVNELGREIEIRGWQKEARPTIVSADTGPRPFHFDDSGPIHFRPKEFGWMWSGSFHVRRSRREVTMLLRHKLKGLEIMATVEINSKQKDGTCVIVFRPCRHAPYRVENRTMYPIQFRQVFSVYDVEWLSMKAKNNVGAGAVILPYHDSEFAWDEPESARRWIGIRVADIGNAPDNMNRFIGTFRIDHMSPGSVVRLANKLFVAQILSDGPTRVLR